MFYFNIQKFLIFFLCCFIPSFSYYYNTILTSINFTINQYWFSIKFNFFMNNTSIFILSVYITASLPFLIAHSYKLLHLQILLQHSMHLQQTFFVLNSCNDNSHSFSFLCCIYNFFYDKYVFHHNTLLHNIE